jgi:hypothetical protein
VRRAGSRCRPYARHGRRSAADPARPGRAKLILPDGTIEWLGGRQRPADRRHEALRARRRRAALLRLSREMPSDWKLAIRRGRLRYDLPTGDAGDLREPHLPAQLWVAGTTPIAQCSWAGTRGYRVASSIRWLCRRPSAAERRGRDELPLFGRPPAVRRRGQPQLGRGRGGGAALDVAYVGRGCPRARPPSARHFGARGGTERIAAPRAWRASTSGRDPGRVAVSIIASGWCRGRRPRGAPARRRWPVRPPPGRGGDRRDALDPVRMTVERYRATSPSTAGRLAPSAARRCRAVS